MNKKLTIIVPVYNGERFIETCLRSLVNQLRDDAELIVVNDGSIDATDHIITTEFQALLDGGNLLYLPTSNAGVSAARNLGLKKASGEYIAFVDADDIVSADYITTILEATADSPSIIEFGYRTIDQHGNVLKDRCFVHAKFGKHAPGVVLDTVFAACLWYPFLRVFRRELFNNILFPVGVRFGEDLMALSAVYKQAGVIYTLPDLLYDYRINPVGATLNIKSDYATHLIAFYRQITHEQSFANKALKVNLAYAIRRCTADTTDPLGRMPPDIEADVRSLLLTPSLFFHIRSRLMAYALWGPILYRGKLFSKHFSLISTKSA
jgi:glycosyltransferase involved in cell wall biosynthesis